MKSFLAPMENYTNAPFRLLCQRYGAEALCVPFVHAPAVVRGKILADPCESEKNIGVQIVGGKGEEIGRAAEIIMDNFPFIKWLNINCGCPSFKTRKCGGGSEIMEHPQEIKKALKLMERLGVPLSLKIRLLNSPQKTLEWCKQFDVDLIIIHGRTPSQFYSGRADWDAIRYIKEKLEIKVVGNGDIRSAKEGEEKVKKGYCDGYMVGREAMKNPALFSNTRKKPHEILKEYIKMCEKTSSLNLKDIKIKALQFMHNEKNASVKRNALGQAKTIEEIEEITAQPF